MQTKDINFFVQFSTKGAVFPPLQNLKTYLNSLKLTTNFSTCFSHIYSSIFVVVAYLLLFCFVSFTNGTFNWILVMFLQKMIRLYQTFFHKKGRKKKGKNWVKTLTFKTSHTVTLSSESLVITCLLFLKTWNFLMLGAPVYKWKNISLIWCYKVGRIGRPVGWTFNLQHNTETWFSRDHHFCQ